MAKNTTARNVLTVLLGTGEPAAVITPPDHSHPLWRRVLAGLLGVQLESRPEPRERPPHPAAHRPRPLGATGRASSLRRLRTSNFLVRLGGADLEVLSMAPSEEPKFRGVAIAILITSGLSAVSMWLGLTTGLGVNRFLAVLPALAWGLIIMSIDRWLLISVPLGSGRRTFVAAAPRVLLSFLLSAVITTSSVIQIFQSQLDSQIAVSQTAKISQLNAELQTSALGQQVTSWQGQVSYLERVISSGGMASINLFADQILQTLQAQLKAATTQESADYQTWQCQLYGGQGCPKGSGPLAEAARQAYLDDRNRVNQLNAEIQTREAALTATNSQAQQVRLAEARAELPRAQNYLVTAQRALQQQRSSILTGLYSYNFLHLRLEALGTLLTSDAVVVATCVLLYILFVLIESLPVVIRLLQRPGAYEVLLASRDELRMKVALMQRNLGIQQQGRPEPSAAPGMPPQFQDDRPKPAQAPDPAMTDTRADGIDASFFLDPASGAIPPEYHAPLVDCLLAISPSVNSLLRRGRSNEEIGDFLRQFTRHLTDMVARQLDEAQQSAHSAGAVPVGGQFAELQISPHAAPDAATMVRPVARPACNPGACADRLLHEALPADPEETRCDSYVHTKILTSNTADSTTVIPDRQNVRPKTCRAGFLSQAATPSCTRRRIAATRLQAAEDSAAIERPNHIPAPRSSGPRRIREICAASKSRQEARSAIVIGGLSRRPEAATTRSFPGSHRLRETRGGSVSLAEPGTGTPAAECRVERLLSAVPPGCSCACRSRRTALARASVWSLASG
jgi:Domain of unknown function (DUF4407)